MDLSAHLRERLASLAPAGGRLLVAVSGGADSVALLRGAVAAGFDVVAAHLDHSLRPESADEAEFVALLAGELGVDFICERLDIGLIARERGWNLEETARKVRYEFLSRSARDTGARAVMTAHTLDDQAETVLMQLLRGSAYLRGMPSIRRKLLRPLLDVPRAQLEAYLNELGQTWCEDVSNRDTRLLRAWLRHEIVPRLGERYPAIGFRLARHARIQRDVEDYVRSEAHRLLRGGGFDQARMLKAHEALQREAIRWLFEQAGVAPTSDLIEEVRGRLQEKSPYRLTLAPGVVLRLAYGRLELVRRPADRGAATASRPVYDATELPVGVPLAALDYPQLELRARKPGDRMRLPGGSKSLARVLMDRKVPREERDELMVLASGKRILWAEGVGPAADLGTAADEGRQERGEVGFMRRALALAEAAAKAGELPVGAVVTRGNEIVGEGHNETAASRDPTAHAEVLAMRRAAERLGDWRLNDCTLFVTLEPCPMCTGAVLESHLPRVVYGASNARDGALGSVTDLLAAPWKREVEVRRGVLAKEAGERLSSFFAERRRGSS